MTRFIETLSQKLKETSLANASKQRVRIDASQFEQWHILVKGRPIDPDNMDLSNQDVLAFVIWLSQSNVPSTVNRKKASLRTVLKVLDMDLLTRLDIHSSPVEKKPVQAWSGDEAAIILSSINELSPRDAAICHVLFWTGARSSQVADLKVSSVDMTSKTIRIGGKDIPMPEQLYDVLGDWLCFRPPVQHQKLFTSEKYPFAPISRWVVHNVWARELASLLPEHLAGPPKDARRNMAATLLSIGASAKDVSRMMGAVTKEDRMMDAAAEALSPGHGWRSVKRA